MEKKGLEKSHLMTENHRTILAQLAQFFADQSEGLSKSQRLVQAIILMTERGFWITGDKIPSESELAEALPVGLSTVQSALRRLSDHGLIIRKKKAGSFIADPEDSSEGIYFYGFYDAKNGQAMGLRDLSIAISLVKDQGEWSRFLGPAQGYVRVERVLSVGHRFKILSHLYLKYPDFGLLLSKDPNELMNVTFRHLLQDQYGIVFGASDRHIAFATLDKTLAMRLDAAINDKAMRYDILQNNIHGDAVFYTQTIIPDNDSILKVAAKE